jgi:hypothetical protein
MNAPVKPGDLVRVNEPDYMYGCGVLVLRVTRVGVIQMLRDGAWLDLEGCTLRSDGTPVNTRLRHVVVRLSALRSPASRQLR